MRYDCIFQMMAYAWPDIALAMRPVEQSTKVEVEPGRSPICRTGGTKRLMEAVLRRTIRPETNNKAWIHMSGYKEATSSIDRIKLRVSQQGCNVSRQPMEL